MDTIENKNELLKLFNLPFSNFSAPIPWSDGLGFSVTESYGNGYSSLYKIGIFNQSQEKRKKLTISVSYGKEVDGGISLGTGKNGIWDPVDLNFYDEFFYDDQEKKFFHKDKEISAQELLLYLQNIHKKPKKFVKGFIVKIRLWYWRKGLTRFIKIIDIFLIYLLYIISGEKARGSIINRVFERNDEKITEPFQFEAGKTMDFFGYKAKRWSVVFYCSLHLLIYFFFFYLLGNHFSLVSKVSNSNFLTLCYVVVSFAITESLIPDLIKKAIKITPKIFSKIAFKSIKI